MPPVIQITRRGTVTNAAGLAPLQQTFADQHCVKLAGLLEPAVAADVQARIERGRFSEFAHGSIATELRLEPGVGTGVLHFLANDPHLFRLVEAVSGCRGLRAFAGRVYRRFPGGQHYDHWHDDADGRRQVGMSINLSAEPYEGGIFEIRDAASERVLAALPNIGVGDAILFRLADTVEHRVSDVRGVAPKTAFAGWFFADLDFAAALRSTAAE